MGYAFNLCKTHTFVVPYIRETEKKELEWYRTELELWMLQMR